MRETSGGAVRKAHCEGASDPCLTLYMDLPTLIAHNRLHDGKADPGTAGLTAAGEVGAAEAIEDMGKMRRLCESYDRY